MITKETIDEIFETSRIEEVVGEFVSLKKRGANMVANCPFHNEKTPSFYVSPSKGIYKCFGCGKAGNSVNFIMEHEHFTYPEALRWLANKYSIEIDEEERTAEQEQAISETESLFNLNQFASAYFEQNLYETQEGKAIGLSYFQERGFRADIIKKFQLGYCIDQWEDFTSHAKKNGYKQEFLTKTGLTIEKDDGKTYDRFRGRVMFPIHNLSGRILGFGGRILTSDKTKAKYVNSPESEVYNKSKILYGLYFSKNQIISKDNCYLVEGYTDVISMHQAGIENVVASSGTSLTTEQIKLISRYTKNVTILYDGDPAGIKASFRGIDMILEQGMNVKIVLFPDGEDPDSFARKHSSTEVETFIKNNANDFITFKTGLLIQETKNDPVKRAGMIKEIVQTISLVPDQIIRNEFIRECSSIVDVKEQTLMNELNKLLRNKYVKENIPEEQQDLIPETPPVPITQRDVYETDNKEILEQEIIRILLNYGHYEIKPTQPKDPDQMKKVLKEGRKIETVYLESVNVAWLIIHDLLEDSIEPENPVYKKIIEIYKESIEKQVLPEEKSFLSHPTKEIRETCTDLLFTPYSLSENWMRKMIFVPLETDPKNLAQRVQKTLWAYKVKMLEEQKRKIQQEIKTIQNSEDQELIMGLIVKSKNINHALRVLNYNLGRVVVK